MNTAQTIQRVEQAKTKAELSTLLDLIGDDIDGLDWTDSEFAQILKTVEHRAHLLTATPYTHAH